MNITDLISGEWKRITGCTLFRGVVEDIIARALEDERCRLIVLKKNAVVFDVYDYRNCLGLVLSGSIAVTKPSGSRYVMTNLWRGSLFGSANLYDDDTDVVSVLTASSACRIVFFPRALVEALMGEANDIALNYIRFLTGRVRFLNDRIQGLVSGSAEAALKQYLMQSAAASGDNNIVRLPGSISSLAGTLNIGRASLYRAFESLERAGIIKKTGKEIEITSPDGLSIIE